MKLRQRDFIDKIVLNFASEQTEAQSKMAENFPRNEKLQILMENLISSDGISVFSNRH